MVLLPSLVPLEAGLLVISLLIGKFHASSTDGRGLVNFAEVEGVFGFELEGGGIFINVVLRNLIRWCKLGGGAFFLMALE